MIQLFDRLRISFALSPAILILQIWVFVNSNRSLLKTLGLYESLILVVISSILIAYIIVTTVCYAIHIWLSKYKS